MLYLMAPCFAGIPSELVACSRFCVSLERLLSIVPTSEQNNKETDPFQIYCTVGWIHDDYETNIATVNHYGYGLHFSGASIE